MTQPGVPTADQDLFVDSLESDIAESLKDPEYRAAFEDVSARYSLIERLVRLRKQKRLTQKQVARRMNVGQSTVAGFETEGSDPRLSTVQRYARAVEARCVVTIQVAVECDWVTPVLRYSERETRRTMTVDKSMPSKQTAAWAARPSAFDLAA